MQFEWDEEKNALNKRNHKVDFMEAAKVFLDENRIEIFDPRFDEDRWITIGNIGKVLYVVYTVREKEVIRLISARLATPEERRQYYNGSIYFE